MEIHESIATVGDTAAAIGDGAPGGRRRRSPGITRQTGRQVPRAMSSASQEAAAVGLSATLVRGLGAHRERLRVSFQGVENSDDAFPPSGGRRDDEPGEPLTDRVCALQVLHSAEPIRRAHGLPKVLKTWRSRRFSRGCFTTSESCSRCACSSVRRPRPAYASAARSRKPSYLDVATSKAQARAGFSFAVSARDLRTGRGNHFPRDLVSSIGTRCFY